MWGGGQANFVCGVGGQARQVKLYSGRVTV